MEISHEAVMAKMEIELQRGKQSIKPSEIREHVSVIRALCDLILDDEAVSQEIVRERSVQISNEEFYPAPIQQDQPSTVISAPTKEPIKMEDGSNGSSLFDF
jgi:hypothetical protein